jgi:hypothetical protein
VKNIADPVRFRSGRGSPVSAVAAKPPCFAVRTPSCVVCCGLGDRHRHNRWLRPWGTADQHDAARGDGRCVAWSDAGKPSIAVLPFDNMSGDPQQGLTESPRT